MAAIKMLVVVVFVLHISTAWCEPNDLQEIDMQAVGRPFALGDLYDRHRDYIIDGPKIWTHEELSNYVQTESHSEEFDVRASQSINEEMSYFDLGASLKMSFLSGLVSVSGAASYMDHRKKKNNVARVSLKYKSTTFVRELKPELFHKVSLPHVLKNAEEATDVVYKIQYGAGAIFSFEKAVKENEIAKDIEGELQVVVKKVPQFQVDAKGHVKISDEDRKNGENLSCTFYGDFVLKTHPGTYEEAIRVYKTINTTAGNVPVKVWLYPLEKLPISKHHKIFNHIQDSIINDVTDVLSELENSVRDANDILASVVGNNHARIRVKVKRFHDYVKRYAVLFKQKLATSAPKVRTGELSSAVFPKMIAEKESSPFSKDKLQNWIGNYKQEVTVLTANHDNLGGFSDYCGIEGDFSARLLRKVRYTVGLTLKLDSMYSPYLDELDEHLLEKETTRSASKGKHKKWWDPTGPIIAQLLALSTSFGDCYRLRAKKKMLENSGVQFLVREVTLAGPNDEPGISIELYDQGVLRDKNYVLTSEPSIPIVTAKTHNSITLKWGNPDQGVKNLKGFKVTTYVPKDSHNNMTDCSFFGSICEFSTTLSSSTSAKVTGLSPLSAYYFTVSAYTHIGETSISETAEQIFTTDCSPGNKRKGLHECESCPPGTYSDQPGVTSCMICPPGTFNPKYGAKSKKECISCPAGTYNVGAGSHHLKDCTPCSRGFYSSKLAASDEGTCQKCPMGTYSSEPGTTECVKCNTDSYNPNSGEKKCLKCPTGTESKVEGATSKSQCLPLDPVMTLDRKIDAVHTHVEHKYSEMDQQVKVTGKGVDMLLKTIDHEEKDISRQITENGKELGKKFDTIHGCDWMKGEGVSELQPIHVSTITSRESCIYNCLVVQKRFSAVNGVSRKLSNGECQCLQEMKSETAHSTRYEACLFK